MGKSSVFSEIKDELIKVSWPTKKEATKLTIIVFIISLIVALYLGIIDILLAKFLEFITKFK